MNKVTLIIATVGVLSILGGCAEDNYNASYNSYDNRSNYDRKMDYVAQDAVNDVASNLSAQDIKNINNLK